MVVLVGSLKKKEEEGYYELIRFGGGKRRKINCEEDI